MKVLPLPGVLRSWISPPSRFDKLAADGETETGAAIFAAGAGVGLLEGLEDDLLLFGRNADAGIRHFERNDGRRLAQHRMLGTPAADAPPRRLSCTPPCSVNLKALDSRFLRTCCRRLESVKMLRPRLRIELDVERELPRFRLVPERPRDRFEQIREEDLLGFDRDRAGFDLREIENVADQVEQIGAGAVDGAREFDLLGGQIAVGIVGELLAKDQDAVQRRPQFMRHIGQEFGLVLRGQRQFGRLFLERAPGLLDLLVLALDLDVALGELLGLLLELLVGLLQFFSAASAIRWRAAATA